MNLQDYNGAIDSYKKALSLDANLKKAYFNIAGAYCNIGDMKNAIKYWEKTIDYDKNNISAYLNLATVYMENSNDKTKAKRYARSAYELNKLDCQVVLKYALVLMHCDDYYRSLEKLQEALKIDQNSAEVKIALAQCYLKLNKTDEAFEMLESCPKEAQESQNYLIVKLMYLTEILKFDANNEIKDTIIQICDKIQTDFGNIPMVEEIKQMHIQE